MEERKRPGPFKIIGLVLLALVLAVACYLSAGLSDLSLGLGNWGLYTTDGSSLYLASAYLQTDTRDVLICSRKEAPADGALVSYLLDGRRVVDQYDSLLGRPVLAAEGSFTAPEPVRYILHDGGAVLRFLQQWRWCIWGFTAGAALVFVVLTVTADARWRRRQQDLMRKNFRIYGEKYAQEEDDMDY